jgi:hypothetical protein
MRVRFNCVGLLFCCYGASHVPIRWHLRTPHIVQRQFCSRAAVSAKSHRGMLECALPAREKKTLAIRVADTKIIFKLASSALTCIRQMTAQYWAILGRHPTKYFLVGRSRRMSSS